MGAVAALAAGASCRRWGLVTLPHSTAGLLRSVEHVYGLPYLGDATDPNNGSLRGALVPGRSTGRPAAPIFRGAVAGTGTGTKGEVTSVRGQSLAFNGVYRYPSGKTVEVGENADGQGVAATSALGSVAVPGISNLESVSCPSPSRCYAVGRAHGQLRRRGAGDDHQRAAHHGQGAAGLVRAARHILRDRHDLRGGRL